MLWPLLAVLVHVSQMVPWLAAVVGMCGGVGVGVAGVGRVGVVVAVGGVVAGVAVACVCVWAMVVAGGGVVVGCWRRGCCHDG